MSLGLALTDEPCYVVSGDIFFTKDLIQELETAPADAVLTDNRENRTLTAIHCTVDENNEIRETYQGPIRNNEHPEAVGMFKVSNVATLREWRKLCIKHGNLFAGQILPCNHTSIHAYPLKEHMFDEINTPADYLGLLNKRSPAYD